tara:strand:+ start:38 stop:385 length:348 start_codon:yes stop_codon:yes gene_type:complete
MRHIYNAFSIDAKYSKLEATKQFIKLSRGMSNENYDLLLEQYMILIDEDVRNYYKKINSLKRFSNTQEVEGFINNQTTYAKMKALIDERLGACNRNNISSVVFTLLRKEIYDFSL